jgi:hypothetical protein
MITLLVLLTHNPNCADKAIYVSRYRMLFDGTRPKVDGVVSTISKPHVSRQLGRER